MHSRPEPLISLEVMGARGRILSQLLKFALKKYSFGCRKFALLETTSVMDSLHGLLVLEVSLRQDVFFIH